MDRNDRIRQSFTPNMRLVELGPSYNPIVAKAAGWHTTVIDHATKAELQQKYAGIAYQVEDVDIVWRDGQLIDAVPPELHGSFDGFIASHVGEHVPDFLGLLNAADRLLNPSGIFFLALPDKRRCFDFFQPLSTAGMVLDGMGRSRHSRGVIFDDRAYQALRGGEGAWANDGAYKPFSLAQDFTHAQAIVTQDMDTAYIDGHKWRFTPASFELLMLELNVLRLTPWAIKTLEPQDAVEFFVWLERRSYDLSAEAIAEQRLHLLREMVMETQEQIGQLTAPREPATVSTPSQNGIAAVVPLYNGGRFIQQAVQSILAQTLPPTEIIVVDDGSTDDGPNLVEAMAQADSRIRLLRKSNGGQSSARNFGVRHASTACQLIALLDQDDMWYPQHLERLIEPFLQTPTGSELGWVYSDLDEVDTDGLMIFHQFLRTLPTQHPKRSLFSALQDDMFVLPSASMIARKAFDAVGGFDERLSGYEDDDLFLRLFRAGYNNIFLDEALSKWRIYPESSSYSYRMRRSRAIYMRKLLEMYPDDPRRARYLQRDLILPRFYQHAVVEYRNALIARDADRINETREELVFLVNRLPRKQRIFGRVLGMVRSPRAAQLAFAMRNVARPIMRRMI